MLGCATNKDSLLFVTLRYISTTIWIFFQKAVGGSDEGLARVQRGFGRGPVGSGGGPAGV